MGLMVRSIHSEAASGAPNGSGLAVHEGDRRIALALYQAQSPGYAPSIPSRTLKPKSFAEIATLVRHRGWTQAFRVLKAQGLIGEQTLGHVVARWGRPPMRAAAINPWPREEIRAAGSPAPSRSG